MPASGLLDFLRLSFLDMAQFIAHQRKLLLNLVIINEAKFVAVKKSVSLLISAKKRGFRDTQLQNISALIKQSN